MDNEKKVNDLPDIQQYIAEVRGEQEALLEELGKIPAPSHQEDLRASYCRDWFASLGADVHIDAAKNVIVEMNCDGDGPLTVYMAHTDIVFEDTQPLPMRREGDMLYAPGIGDDTANLTNLMMAYKYLKNTGFKPEKGGYLIIANSCEEGLGNLDGTKQIFADYGSRIEAFYSFDGGLGTCCNDAVGSYRYEIKIKAKGGHSYGAFGNSNAIERLAAIIEKLYEIPLPAKGKTTYNAGKIWGGSTVNSIAQEAGMLYEFRSPSQDNLKYMSECFEKTVDSFRAEDCEIIVTVLGIRPGKGSFDEEKLSVFTKRNTEIISRFYDGDIHHTPSSTDANIPLSIGTAANTIGTVKGERAHTREECVDLKSLPVGLSIVLTLMLEGPGIL